MSLNILKYTEQKQGDSFNGTWVTTQLLEQGHTIELSLNTLKYTEQKQGDSFNGTWVTTQLLEQGHTIELSLNTLKYAEQKQGDSFNGTWVSTQLLEQEHTTELTPSLPQPVKILGWMMQRRACKHRPITSLFNAVCFDENPFTCQCEKEDKKT